MHYEGNIIRPPSEAFSIILQVTVGCSHNKCTFCGTYKEEPFRIKEDAIIREDIEFASQYCRRQKKVFLADGDVLILPYHRLERLFLQIRNRLPWVKRISLYGNTKSIRSKSLEELRQLKKLGLNRVYMGLESGHDQVLATVKKGYNSEAMIEAAAKVKAAGLFLSVTVLLGLAGKELSREHAVATGKVLSRMEPDHIGALTLMLLSNTSLYAEAEKGTFILPDQISLLKELHDMLANIDVTKTLFYSNHASNYLPLECRLPRHKEKALDLIRKAIAGQISLKPEYLRAL